MKRQGLSIQLVYCYLLVIRHLLCYKALVEYANIVRHPSLADAFSIRRAE